MTRMIKFVKLLILKDSKEDWGSAEEKEKKRQYMQLVLKSGMMTYQRQAEKDFIFLTKARFEK